MTYKSLMERLQGIKPEAHSAKNDALAKIATVVLEDLFKTAALGIDTQYKLKFAGALEGVIRRSPHLHPNPSEFADDLMLGKFELGAHNTLAMRSTFELIEGQIGKLYKFGAVEAALSFAERYKALSEQIQ
ncbi:hypothetical protein J4448_00575 [Candidatus Woesearchaeota archaeon]|nr:hypothetical protein [Candidatus Woesearchaeota archaeon]